MSWLIEPWLHGEWMWRAAAAVIMVSLCTAPVGVVLYLRRESMMIDALAHTALPGIVFAVLLTGRINSVVLLLGAAATGVGAAWLIQLLAKRPNMRGDAAMGAVFTTLFALGVLLLSARLRGIHLDAEHALYGNLLAVQNSSIAFLSVWCALVWATVVASRRLLTLVCFDPRYAAALGVPMAVIHLAIMSATSLTAVACFEAVGAVLVVALVIVPAATAHLLSRTFRAMMGWAVSASLLSGFAGLYLSIWLDVSPTGAIVVVLGALYLLAWLFAPEFGVIASHSLRTQET